jgi:threonine dehydratase
LIHPYDNDNVIAGAGTSALELCSETGDLDYIFAPVGGGGLLSGTSIAIKGFCNKTCVIGVEPQSADDARRSFYSGAIIKNEQTPKTIADGLRTNLCERTFSIIKNNVYDIITVEEEEIISAMRFLWEKMKIVVEPSGAVSLAGAILSKNLLKGKRCGIIISGGNVDVSNYFDALYCLK